MWKWLSEATAFLFVVVIGGFGILLISLDESKMWARVVLVIVLTVIIYWAYLLGGIF